MRFKKAKLVILLIGLFAFLGVAGRLAWFATKGKATILSPAEGRQPHDAIQHWWDKERRKIWAKQQDSTTRQTRIPIKLYAAFSSADLSGAEPPKIVEPKVAETRPTGPQPYTHFSDGEIWIRFLHFGGSKFREDDRVCLSFEVKSPRAHLGDAGGKTLDWYAVGESLDPFPEVTIEAMDPSKNSVTFRMPIHRDPENRYEAYLGNEEDSQTQTRVVRAPSMDLGSLGPMSEKESGRLEEEERDRQEASDMRLRALDREASVRTEETFPGSGIWTVGTEDLDELAADYDERMRRDVTFSSYNKNGVVGVQIQRIKEGSVFFSRGLLQNDVVVALNEHPIPTPSEAIRYIRKHPERNSYEIKVLRNGRERTLTYHVPR